jgi:hypothetical protein
MVMDHGPVATSPSTFLPKAREWFASVRSSAIAQPREQAAGVVEDEEFGPRPGELGILSQIPPAKISAPCLAMASARTSPAAARRCS